MLDPTLWMFFTVGFPLLLIGFLIYNTRVQRQSVARVKVSMERQQEMMQAQRHLLEIAEENLAVQHEIRGLLERVAAAAERRV
jgi:hypothetical protein